VRHKTLALENGDSLTVGERIGRGGEGDVHVITDDPSHAVKLYTVTDLDERRDKVRAMVRANLAAKSDLVAFPVAIVNSGGRFAGFTMRRITGRKPLHELYSPGARKSAFPRADYRFLVRTAANIARAVGAVHETGCVIGDVNHSGILIADTATVALIDADSFQYVEGGRRHACRVGVPEYTPPELQGIKLHTVERRVEHDRFGLAVVVFQLLFMGRHPFSGTYSAGEMPIERAIAEHRFAYSRQRQVGMRPPPAVPTLSDMPAPIAAALEEAFSPGGTRPEARQWVQLLTSMEQNLRTCAKSKLHHYSAEASECPWCRMESKQGIVLFLPHASVGLQTIPSDPGAAVFNLGAAWAAIQAVPRPASAIPQPNLPTISVVASEQAIAAKRARRMRKLLGIAALMSAVGGLIALLAAWPVCGGLAWFGLTKLFSDDATTRTTRKEKADIDKRADAAMADWQKRASDEPFRKLSAELSAVRASYIRLPEIERQKISEYQHNRRAEQLKAYLDSFLIRRQKIKGVGDGRVATLLAYGIETALDVTEHAVLNVPGFGPKTAANLLVWRRQLETRFVYNERPNAVDAARMAAIKADIVKQATGMRHKLLAGPAALARSRADIEARRQAVDPQLAALHARQAQLVADLNA